jgi:hypothetical protein
MKSTLAHILAIGLLACLCACSSPVAVITNATSESVSVEIYTDVGESHSVTVPANESVRLNISGRDKELWVVATFINGRKLESKKLYVTSQGVVSSTITNKQVGISYELQG